MGEAMTRLNRCPRCAARRVGEHRYCPNCAFDYAQGLGPALSPSASSPSRPTARSVPRGETGVPPGASRILDPSVVRRPPERDDDVNAIRRDVARVALARNSLVWRSRIGSCLGMLVGLMAAGLVLPAIQASNAILGLVLVFLFIWIGAYLGSWLVVRSIAR